jgi:hypothetical protein
MARQASLQPHFIIMSRLNIGISEPPPLLFYIAASQDGDIIDCVHNSGTFNISFYFYFLPSVKFSAQQACNAV